MSSRRRRSTSKCLVVSLSICLLVVAGQPAAAAERTCGVEFDDVGSSALLAEIVAEGRAKRVLYETAAAAPGSVAQSSPGGGVSVVFDRLRLYKGQLHEADSERRRSIAVGAFGIEADREACVAPLPALDRSYVLFLRRHNDTGLDVRASTDVNGEEDRDGTRRRRRRYRLSAFPARKTRRNIAAVRHYTNCSLPCGTCHVRFSTYSPSSLLRRLQIRRTA